MLRPDEPYIKWSSLRALVHNSNLITIILGGVVVLGLPEALLTDHASCGPARLHVAAMGRWLIVSIGFTALTNIAYSMLAPAPLRDYTNLSDYAADRPADEIDSARENWSLANRGKHISRIVVILLAVTALFFFGLFGLDALSFLEASKSCIPEASASSPAFVDIDLYVRSSR